PPARGAPARQTEAGDPADARSTAGRDRTAAARSGRRAPRRTAPAAPPARPRATTAAACARSERHRARRQLALDGIVQHQEERLACAGCTAGASELQTVVAVAHLHDIAS